jgi:hypothetical protein
MKQPNRVKAAIRAGRKADGYKVVGHVDLVTIYPTNRSASSARTAAFSGSGSLCAKVPS